MHSVNTNVQNMFETCDMGKRTQVKFIKKSLFFCLDQENQAMIFSVIDKVILMLLWKLHIPRGIF